MHARESRPHSGHNEVVGRSLNNSPFARTTALAGSDALAGLSPQDEAALARCLALMLDEVDHGVLLVDGSGAVRFANHAAHVELSDSHPLQLQGGRLLVRQRTDAEPLQQALQASAHRQVRAMLTLGSGAARASVAVLPLGPGLLDGAPATMLMLGRRRVAQNLSVQGFAKSRRLTPAETRVLEGLCAGVAPAQIAEQLNVRISTIRTQIGGIREKTGARSIRELVRQVAVLPPMVPALRESGRARHGGQANGAD